MASRRLEDLHPRLQPLARELLSRARAAGIPILIYCTYRNNDEQLELYKQGREKPGKIVTRAKPGQSPHNAMDAEGKPAALSFDTVPLKDGKAVWDDEALWNNLGAVGRSVGLDWGGDWTGFRDSPHFQLKNWKTFLQPPKPLAKG